MFDDKPDDLGMCIVSTVGDSIKADSYWKRLEGVSLNKLRVWQMSGKSRTYGVISGLEVLNILRRRPVTVDCGPRTVGEVGYVS